MDSYLHKHDKCYRVQKYNGNVHYLAPRPRGDELFLKHGNDISDGAGLLMGMNSPFKNIPGMVIVIIYLGEMYKIKYSVFLLSVWHL